MATNVSYFEQKLIKLIEGRINDLTIMVMAGNLADHAAYQKRTSQVGAFLEVIEKLIPEAHREINEEEK